MPFEESPNSFLFGLNQFTSPAADSQNDSGNNSRSDSMLANLDAFAVSDDVAGGSNHNDANGGQAPNFADQLALWTNANFSFDGPTGHALLGDEEKEKEEAEHNRRREDENRRNQEEERERLARNAAASSRGSHALRGKAREVDSNASGSAGQPYPPTSQPHTPSPHPSQHSQQQQQSHQSYFPGAPNFNASVRPSPATNPPAPGAVGPFQLFNGFPHLQQLGGHAGQNTQQHTPPQPGFGAPGSLDMTSALALQHLLASNPLALASLSQLAGLTNPQLQSHLAGIVNAGAGIGAFNPAQQQAGAPQQQGQQSHATGPVGAGASPWLAAAAAAAASRNGSISGPSPQSTNWGPQLGGGGLPVTSPAQIPSGVAGASTGVNGLVNGTGPHSSSSGNAANNNDAARTNDEASTSASGSGSAPSKKKRTSTSEGKKAQIDADAEDSDEILGRLEDIERRYEIPPLKLIDTGNPEADAEANRLAIEEDKRRRNTAASARFRIKKKQREAALEQAAKELQQRLADLEAENARLRTENGWLKSLITVRPDQAMPGGLDQSAVPNPFSNLAGPSGSGSAQLQHGSGPSTAHASPAPNGDAQFSRDTPDRQSGLHPRGVGTSAEEGSKAKGASSGKNGSNGSGSAQLKRDREE